MITKSVTIDEEKMYQDIYGSLDETYSLVCIDYRDELTGELIQKCLEKKSLEPLYEEDVYSEARYHNAVFALDELLKKKYTQEEIDLFKTTDEYDSLRIEIESRDDSNPEKELFEKTRIPAYIRFHSDYDCWLPVWEEGGIRAGKAALDGIMAALSLNPRKVKEAAMAEDIPVYGTFRNLPRREGKELVDYNSFIRVLCETPNYGNWSFFGRLELDEVLKTDFDIDSMTIPKGTTAAMFNWWNGGGSLDFCETLRDVTVGELKKRLERHSDDLRLVIDDHQNKDHGYKPSEVYGGEVSPDILLTSV
jgi:hypothetical protein